MKIEGLIPFKLKKIFKKVHYRKEITPKKNLWPGLSSSELPDTFAFKSFVWHFSFIFKILIRDGATIISTF